MPARLPPAPPRSYVYFDSTLADEAGSGWCYRLKQNFLVGGDRWLPNCNASPSSACCLFRRHADALSVGKHSPPPNPLLHSILALPAVQV